MVDIYNSLIIYWKPILGAVLIGAVLFGDKIKEAFSKIKIKVPSIKGILPNKVKVVDKKAIELKDNEAIAHLRDRAIQWNDTELLQEIKSIDSRFFDIHSKKDV